MISLTNKYAKQIDKAMTKKYNISSLILMEQAGLRIFETLQDRFDLQNEKISIFCGIGNNGADGLVLARLLYVNNYFVNIYISKNWENGSLEFKKQKKILDSFNLKFYFWDELNIKNKKEFYNTTIYVDALFGTGLNKKLNNFYLKLILNLNEQNGFKLSIDIPSGINGTTGEGKIFFKSDLTITFSFLKWAHLLRDDLGEILLANISFFPKIKLEKKYSLYYMIKEEAKYFFLNRKKNTNKGNFGHVGILGGNYKMAGASLMAGKAALKTGSGLVTIWLDNKKINNLVGKEIELMLEPWKSFLNKNINVLIIGPGLNDAKNIDFQNNLLAFNGPVLIDAGGLNLLKLRILKRDWIKGPLILTPHPKEMANLVGIDIDKINQNRIETAKYCSKKFNCITILKGYKTIITDGTKTAINLTGNPGMSTAGSGDVLSGIIASFLGQIFDPFNSSFLGTYVHGLSGDLARNKYGENSLTSLDIINYLPITLKQIKTINLNKGWTKKIKE